jgi:crotonobetainyl-CoA:carnitine CoA-transferase CaiB-like acyl-CoA transferase
MNRSAGALDGLLVADFSRVLAGPLATMILGDLGADVVKVERPGIGDDTRAWSPPATPDGTASYYLTFNRNKRSLVLDLDSPADLGLARRLALRADVLVENFRPGTMARKGLGYDDLRVENPGLVYCSVSGFGTRGPGAALAGYDFLGQALGGIMSVNGHADGGPVKTGPPISDILAGLNAVIGILAALEARHATGRGQRVEATLLDASLFALVNMASGWLNAGVLPHAVGNRHPSIAPYQTFSAADRPFVVACGSDGQFAALAGLVDRPELADDARFRTNSARVAHREAIEIELTTIFATRPATHWVEALTDAGVPAAVVNDVGEAFAFAETLGTHPVDETDGVRTVRSAVVLHDTPAIVRRRPPRLGEHDAELRAWLEADPD